MNVFQMRRRVDQWIDRSKTARHKEIAYWDAINGSIIDFVKDRTEPIRTKRTYSVQSSQRIREELYTLIPSPATGTITSGIVSRPTGYMYYLLVYATINSEKQLCIPTSYNELGKIEINPFRLPSAIKPYFNENVSGIKIITDIDPTVGTYELHYIKTPDVVFGGKEHQKITDGGTVVTGTTYYCTAPTTYNAIKYDTGETFVAGSVTTLTNGSVIAASNITNCNLPDHTHEEICKLAAAKLKGNVSDLQGKAELKNDVEQN